MTEKPCPARVWVEVERIWIYCEQGPAGHQGTHCGDRTEAEYRALLKASQLAMVPR